MFNFINDTEFYATHKSGNQILVEISNKTGYFVSRYTYYEPLPHVRFDLRHAGVIIGKDTTTQEDVICELMPRQNYNNKECYTITYMSEFSTAILDRPDLNLVVQKGYLDNSNVANSKNYLIQMSNYIEQKKYFQCF